MPDDGVVVFGGEGGCGRFEAGVVIVDFGFFGDGHVAELGGAVEGRDVVDDDVAGAFLVELFSRVSESISVPPRKQLG